MSKLINLDKESLSRDLSVQLARQNKELKESARIVQEEKLFNLHVNEIELCEDSKETVAFVMKIEIEENPPPCNCDLCFVKFQEESEQNFHSCSRTSKEQSPFTNNLNESDRGSEKNIPFEIKQDLASRGEGLQKESKSNASICFRTPKENSFSINECDRLFSDESQREMLLNTKQENLDDAREKNPSESQSEVLADENLYVCDICERGFGEQSQMKSHLCKHKTGRIPYCDVCDRKFRNFGNLENHLRTHAEKKYTCEVCSEEFCLRQLYQRHVLKHERDRAKPFSCTVCGKRFPDEFKMKMHLIGHTLEAGPLVCDICKREFSKKQHLVRHIYIHTGERPFVCEVCNMGFYRQSELKIHAISHDQDRQFRCRFCKKGFLRKNTLNIHLRNHTGDKPFVCSVCKKGFSQACDLKIHSYIHIEERPFLCDVCGKGFYKKSFLVKHRGIHDKMDHAPNVNLNTVVEGESCAKAKNNPRGKGSKQHFCKLCDKSYLTQHRLKIHLCNHSKETFFTCAVCQKVFSRACDLKNHSCAEGKSYACDICSERFSRKCILTKHRRAHEKVNSLVEDGTSDDRIADISWARDTNYSISNKVSGDPKAENYPEEKLTNRFVPNEISDTKVCFVEEMWFSSSSTHSDLSLRLSNKKSATQTPPKTHSSHSHPKSETLVGDECQKRIPSKGEKAPRQGKGKRIGPGSFACNECDKVYFHRYTLKRHLRTHEEEKTGVKGRLWAKRIKSPIESLEENVHLYAPFKNFV